MTAPVHCRPSIEKKWPFAENTFFIEFFIEGSDLRVIDSFSDLPSDFS
jgi:hypothetical protein